MKNLCPVCGFQGEYDEVVFDGSEVIACMMCEEEEEYEEVDLSEYTGNMPCDNSGYCDANNCRNVARCKGWE